MDTVSWEQIEILYVTANGIRFEVAAMGSGDRLALCLHGFPEHAYSWRFQMPLLAKLGYRVWAPNLRGYGGTDSPPEISAYRTELLVEDVACLIRASGARETLLIAHDWGGALAWTLALRQSRLVQRLIVLNLPHPACFIRELKRPVQLLKSWYMLFFQIPRLPEWVLGRNRGRAIASMFLRTTRNPASFSRETLDVYRNNASRPGGLTAMLNWYRALLRGGGLQRFHRELPGKSEQLRPARLRPARLREDERPRKIEIPTLFLWGDADIALSFRTTRGTEQYVSDLTFRVLHGVSHWIQQEAPEAVNVMIEAWLKGARVPEYAEISPQVPSKSF